MVSRRLPTNILRAIGLPGILLALCLALAGCESSEGPVEEAGEEVDQAMEEASEEVEEAADEVEESVQ
jgi:hypothetical protein